VRKRLCPAVSPQATTHLHFLQSSRQPHLQRLCRVCSCCRSQHCIIVRC
jgi:hypothetical protein